MTKSLEELFHRVETWPESARDQLLEVADEIERELDGVYDATLDELQAIDEGGHKLHAAMSLARPRSQQRSPHSAAHEGCLFPACNF